MCQFVQDFLWTDTQHITESRQHIFWHMLWSVCKRTANKSYHSADLQPVRSHAATATSAYKCHFLTHEDKYYRSLSVTSSDHHIHMMITWQHGALHTWLFYNSHIFASQSPTSHKTPSLWNIHEHAHSVQHPQLTVRSFYVPLCLWSISFLKLNQFLNFSKCGRIWIISTALRLTKRRGTEDK